MRSAAIGVLSCLVLLGACGGTVYVGWGYEPCCTYYSSGWSASALAAGDFDGDRMPDLVVADETDGTIYFLKGLGSGAFASPPAAPALGTAGSRHLRVGYLDADDHLDVVVIDPATGLVEVYFGTGSGGFTAAAPAPPLLALSMGVHAVHVADMDADAFADLVVLDESGRIMVLFGAGDGTFSAAPGVPKPVGLTDARGRAGNLAIVVGAFDDLAGTDVAVLDPGAGEVTILSGRGDGTWSANPPFPAQLPQLLVDAAPCTGDGAGRTEIVVMAGFADGSRWIRKLFTRGERAWRLSTPTLPVGNASDMTTVDLNGDGVSDVVVALPDDDALQVFVAVPR